MPVPGKTYQNTTITKHVHVFMLNMSPYSCWYEPILRSASGYASAPGGGIRPLGKREVNPMLGEDRASGSDLLPLPSVDAGEPDEVGDVVSADRRHVAKTGDHGRRCRHDAIRAE